LFALLLCRLQAAGCTPVFLPNVGRKQGLLNGTSGSQKGLKMTEKLKILRQHHSCEVAKAALQRSI